MGCNNRDRLKDVIIPLYLAPMSLHFRYCSKVCLSYKKKDVGKLNPRQVLQADQGTEYLLCGEQSPCGEQLRELGLFSLEKSWRAKSRLTVPGETCR